MTTKYVPRMVNLTEKEYLIIKQAAEERSLGTKGFSAALRLIVSEWDQLRRHPALFIQPQPNEQ